MRDSCFPASAAILAVLIILSVGAFLLPPVHSRLIWRIDGALTYVKNVLAPVGDMPTPIVAEILPQPSITATAFATSTPATPQPPPALSDTPQPTPTALPQTAALPAPKWEKQDWNNCGPAALAMYLRFYGWEGTQHDIAAELKPAREDRNVNVEELAYYTRTHAGWLGVQYRVGGTPDLLKQLLANGIPVMIEESFKFDSGYWPKDDLWGAHYQLLTGYDDAEKIFVGQDSYYGADQKIPYSELEKNWHAFNNVYIVLYPADQEQTVKTILAADWDVDENRRRTLEKSQADTQKNPQDAFAWFNNGTNLVYFERYAEAARAYDEARRLGLPQRMLRYQFGPFIAYFHSGRNDELLALCDYALQRTSNAEEALLWKGWGLYREGEINQARKYFQSALDARSGYEDALYALNFLDSQ